MARSYRKPYFHICKHDSNDKVLANRKFRRVSKQRIVQNKDILPEKLKEVSNIYTWSCDGKPHYWPDGAPKVLRK